MWRAESLEKTLMLGGIGGRRRRGWQRMAEWHHWLDGHESEWIWELMMDREAWRAAIHGVAKSRTWLSNRSDLIWSILYLYFLYNFWDFVFFLFLFLLLFFNIAFLKFQKLLYIFNFCFLVFIINLYLWEPNLQYPYLLGSEITDLTVSPFWTLLFLHQVTCVSSLTLLCSTQFCEFLCVPDGGEHLGNWLLALSVSLLAFSTFILLAYLCPLPPSSRLYITPWTSLSGLVVECT